MLEHYFIRPDTVDRIRSSWLGEPIEKYVIWLRENKYANRNVYRRVPILVQFANYAWSQGCRQWANLPAVVNQFATVWEGEHERNSKARCKVHNAAASIVRQMLALLLPGYQASGRMKKHEEPFFGQAPGFFTYLRQERGLRDMSIRQYRYSLVRFAAYLDKFGCHRLLDICPVLLSAFVTDASQEVGKSAMRTLCSCLRVFLRYLCRERLVQNDLSQIVEHPQVYRLADIPRSISWDEVRRMLDAVDRRISLGKRDYAILLLLVTYGLRAREVAALTLDDVDWKRERLRVPERKAGHSTAYPLSPLVGEAIIDYLSHGRPKTNDRHLFFRVLAPQAPLTWAAISGRASHYLHKAGITVARPGSHTLRHTCVQRLVDAGFDLKVIGGYVGHRSPSSTEIYSKVAVEDLREVALGDGEEIV